MFKKGLVHLYFGDGQGKTCAAVGLAMRVAGCGGKVLYAQFLKNGRSGELAALKRLPESITVMEGKPSLKFFKDMNEAEKALAIMDQQDVFESVKERIGSGEYDLLVLDEIGDAADLGMIVTDELLAFLHGKPETLEVALTGHKAIPELIGAADYVSEIRKAKHPYDNGVKARRGAEF